MNATQNTQNTPANLQGAMAHAILSATKELTEQPTPKDEPIKGRGHPPMIVCRVDLLGNKIVFFAETQSKDGTSIQMWDGKKNSKPREVSINYYRSTKVIDSAEERTKLVQDFSKEFRVTEVVLRQRLLKSHLVERDEKGQSEKVDLDAFKLKLIEAVTLAIMAA